MAILLAGAGMGSASGQAPMRPDAAEIQLALKKLRVLGSVLFVGAHPDDENNELIAYLAKGRLHVEKMGRGIAWLDTGTHEALLQASTFIQVIEERQALKVACLEEIAFRLDYIDRAQLEAAAGRLRKSPYGDYLLRIAREGH